MAKGRKAKRARTPEEEVFHVGAFFCLLEATLA